MKRYNNYIVFESEADFEAHAHKGGWYHIGEFGLWEALLPSGFPCYYEFTVGDADPTFKRWYPCTKEKALEGMQAWKAQTLEKLDAIFDFLNNN